MDLKKILVQDNPWWTKESERIDTPDFERDIVDDIADDKPLSTVLFGPRQSGKTTIFQQVINKRLARGDRKILYAAMDRFPERSLSEVIQAYKEITGNTEGTYFFDEVHNVSNWALELKSLVDSCKNHGFYATGSSSIVLLSGGAESGVGRFEYRYVSPFTFGEYCSYNGFHNKVKNIFDLKDQKQDRLISMDQDLKPLLSRYLLWGGFPGQFHFDFGLDMWQNYLRQNYVSLTIYKDIISNFDVREPSLLEDILNLISEKTGVPLSYTSMTKSFNVSFEAIRNYIHYLESSGLIMECEYHTKNVLKRKRRNKKFYIVDPGLNSALRYKRVLDERFTSINLELAVANSLREYIRRSTGLINPKVNHWKDRYEVDFVVKVGAETLPVEVKYKGEVKDSDLKGIVTFMKEKDVKRGMVITKGSYEERNIQGCILDLIPATVFLNSLNH